MTKKLLMIVVIMVALSRFASGQVICIYCYNQNAPVSNPITNLLTNGGFEAGTCTPYPTWDVFCPNASAYSCDITNWTCTGGGTQTYCLIYDITSSAIVEGTKAAYLGNNFCMFCNSTVGDISCVTDSLCSVIGVPAGYPDHDILYGGSTGVSIEQTVSGLTIGNTYVLEFWCGGEDFGFFTNQGVFGLDVGFGRMLLHCNPTDNGDIGTRYIIEFNAVATSHTIKFTNWGHVCNTCTEVVLDDSRLYTLAQLSPSVPSCSSSIGSTLSGYSDVCSGSCTNITAAPVGGTAPYNYVWTPPVGAGPGPHQICPTSTTTYTVTITDANSNTSSSSATVNVFPLPTLVTNSTNVLCNGGATGSASVNASGATAPYSYSWSAPGGTNPNLNNLSAGTYTVTVTDANGCTQTATALVTEPPAISLSFSGINADCGLQNGEATVNASGGSPGYTYLWNNGQTTATDTGLAAGLYTVTVTDANGCTSADTISVGNNPPAGFTISNDTTIQLGQSAQLFATGGVSYLWTPATALSCTTCPNPVASPLVTTLYCVDVTDSNGCTFNACVRVYVESPCGEVFIPSAFSPNGDHANDMECVFGNCITQMTFSIYDRWGEKVFETTDSKKCWDGTFRGEPMNTAVFVYYLEATLLTGEKISRKGNVSLVR